MVWFESILVNFVPIDLIPLGRKNIENLKNQGADCIEFTPNPKVYRKMEKYGLVELGDANWPEHIGIFTVPAQVAVAYKIPLIIWGENPQVEYGGPGVGDVLDRKWLESYGGFWLDKVNPVEVIMKQGIERRHLKPYIYPTDEEINQVGVRGIFLGQYLQYDIYKEIEKILVDKVVFTHGGVDEKMFNAACLKYDLPLINITWLNSATLVRRTWTEYSKSGYGLENMTGVLKIDYNSHNAASDAFATAKIIYLASVKKEIFSIEDWIEELKTKSRKNMNNYFNYDQSQKISGDLTEAPDLNSIENKDNYFFGKKVVVSGTYDNWPDRKELAKILKDLGADIDTNIGKKTNILCAGDGVGPKKIEKMQLKISQGDNAEIIDEEKIVSILESYSIDY